MIPYAYMGLISKEANDRIRRKRVTATEGSEVASPDHCRLSGRVLRPAANALNRILAPYCDRKEGIQKGLAAGSEHLHAHAVIIRLPSTIGPKH